MATTLTSTFNNHGDDTRAHNNNHNSNNNNDNNTHTNTTRTNNNHGNNNDNQSQRRQRHLLQHDTTKTQGLQQNNKAEPPNKAAATENCPPQTNRLAADRQGITCWLAGVRRLRQRAAWPSGPRGRCRSTQHMPAGAAHAGGSCVWTTGPLTVPGGGDCERAPAPIQQPNNTTPTHNKNSNRNSKQQRTFNQPSQPTKTNQPTNS